MKRRRALCLFYIAHDLVRKPVPIPDRGRGHAFRDHALARTGHAQNGPLGRSGSDPSCTTHDPRTDTPGGAASAPGDQPERRPTMRKITGIAITLASAIGFGLLTGLAASIAKAEDASAQAAYRDIQQTLGSVPGFFK